MKKIACTIIRGGSSKGVFFEREVLPPVGPERDKCVLAAFGSPDTFLVINPPENGERDVLLSIESNGCISDTLLSDAFSIYGPTGYFEANMDCSSPLDYEFTAFMNDAESYAWISGELMLLFMTSLTIESIRTP